MGIQWFHVCQLTFHFTPVHYMCEIHLYKWTFVYYRERIHSIVVIFCQGFSDILNNTYTRHCVIYLNISLQKLTNLR